MIPLAHKTHTWLAVAVLVFSLFFAGVMLVPETVSAFTYAWSLTIALALAAIALTSWRNGRTTGSIAQLLHDTEGERRQDGK